MRRSYRSFAPNVSLERQHPASSLYETISDVESGERDGDFKKEKPSKEVTYGYQADSARSDRTRRCEEYRGGLYFHKEERERYQISPITSLMISQVR